jgi:penicillin amidase
MEPGGSPYLASLRMNQAKNWDEFREACNFSNIPGENMIWADREGNIGWQAVGIAPVRKNFSGLVPVPGDGRYEWDGYLPIIQKPSINNPEKGFIATANQNVTPENYTHWDAIAYRWSDAYRGNRINEILGSGKKLSWDYVLDNWSIPAGIYVAWEKELLRKMFEYMPDPEAREVIANVQMTTLIRWILNPETKFGQEAESKRDNYLRGTFTTAVEGLSRRFGDNMASWQYGQEQYKHVKLIHPLGEVVNKKLQAQLNTPLMPRGGNQHTPGSTSGANNQTSGASFRIIVDVNDWDSSVGTNSPGQSGDPESRFYKNLFVPWAKDEYFPVYFSKHKIESVVFEKIKLIPKNGDHQNL